MTNSKSTKRALVSSALAILMCVAMLIGTTFAWFTDTASTGVNKITSGNLHVEIQDEASEPIANLEWVAKDGRPQDEILWEPGATYTLTPFKIANTGNLALKYKMVVTGLDGDADLLRVIKFTYKLGDAVLDLNEEGHLAAGAATGMITVSATMDKNAGNEYMDKTLEGVEIKVYATQDTVENDSFGNTYDENATYPVANASDFSNAITSAQDGDVIALAGPVDFADTTVSLDKDITISGDNAEIKNALFTVADGKTVAFDGVSVSDTVTIRAADDASLKFTDCELNITPQKVNGNGRAAAIVGNHQYSNVDLTLEGCTFNYKYTFDVTEDRYNMAVFMWSNVENVLIKNCQFNDYGFVAVKFLEMKAGANIVFEGNTFNMSHRSDSNWYYNTAVQIHTVNQPDGACHVSFINNVFNGDYQTGTESEYAGYELSSAPIVAELMWNASESPLNNTVLTIRGNMVNGVAVTEDNFVFIRGTGSSVQ